MKKLAIAIVLLLSNPVSALENGNLYCESTSAAQAGLPIHINITTGQVIIESDDFGPITGTYTMTSPWLERNVINANTGDSVFGSTRYVRLREIGKFVILDGAVFVKEYGHEQLRHTSSLQLKCSQTTNMD